MPNTFLQGILFAVRLVLAIDLILIGRWCVYLFYLSNWRRTQASPETALPNTASPPRPTPPFAAEWSLVHPFLAIQIILVLAELLGAVALLVAGGAAAAPLERWSGPMANAMLFGLFVQEFLFVAAVAFFLWRYRSSLRDIGLRMLPIRQIYSALALGIAMFLLSGIADAGFSAILHRLISPATFQALEQFAKTVSAEGVYAQIPYAPQKAALIVAGVVCAPMAEEIFFRGFLYNTLARRFRRPVAVLLSAACFALLHMNPLSMGIIFIMGIVLAVAYHRTGSLTFTILVHAVNNGLSFAVLAMSGKH